MKVALAQELPSIERTIYSFSEACSNRDLRSFPTRRSSDLRSGPPPRRSHAPRIVGPLSPASPLRERRQLLECGERSEEHTSELQSPCKLVCRLLLEKKKSRKSN